MFFRFKFYLGLSTILLLGSYSAFAVETVLSYSLTEIHTPAPEASKNPAAEKVTRLSSKKTVVLGNGFFSVSEGKLERIYDFKNRRIHYLDHREKTRIDISLFADPAFRIAELQSRLNMEDAVKKAGGLPLEDLFSLESIFGVESETHKADLKEDLSEKGKTRFLESEKQRAEISWGEKPLSDETGMFSKFLIYDNSLHPLVRRKIAGTRQIPDVIRSQLKNTGATDEFVLILDDVKTRADQGFQVPKKYPISKRRPGMISSAESLAQVLRSTEPGKKQIKKYEKAWFLEKINQAKAKNNFLDAALLVLEYGLQTGDQKSTTEEMQRLAEYQKEDRELDRFFRSLGISGKEQAARAIEELQKINRKNLSRAHVIDIMIAGQQSVLGQNVEAQKRMIGALKVNPYIAGVYKDLGDLYYTEFDMVSAWVCWDFARKQAPGHFMLVPIFDFETELLKDFSDFF